MGSHGNVLAVSFFMCSRAHNFHFSIEKRCGKLGRYVSFIEIHVLYNHSVRALVNWKFGRATFQWCIIFYFGPCLLNPQIKYSSPLQIHSKQNIKSTSYVWMYEFLTTWCSHKTKYFRKHLEKSRRTFENNFRSYCIQIGQQLCRVEFFETSGKAIFWRFRSFIQAND